MICKLRPPTPQDREIESVRSIKLTVACFAAWPSLRGCGYILRPGRYTPLDTLKAATALPVRGRECEM